MKSDTTVFRNKVIAHFIVSSIALILLGKVLFLSTDYLPLYVYGVMVTAILLVTFIAALFFYHDPAVTAEEILGNKEQVVFPRVSCMVAVFNEEENIEWCIHSMITQGYKNKEIIIVNDKSTDGTAAILDRLAMHTGVKVLHLDKNVGKKRALGQAMRIAEGEIFAFSDSDCVWAPNVLEKMVPIFLAYPNVGAVSGHGRALNAEKNILTRAQDSWYEGQFAIRKAFESIFGAVTCVSGPLAVFRKEAIFNYIPAWEQDSFLGQEFRFSTDRTLTGFVLGSQHIGRALKQRYVDTDFVKSVDYPERDWDIVYSKSAKSWTIVPDTWKRLLSQQIRWKKSFIRNIFFTGAFYWRKPLLPAVIYYAHILFVLAGPFIAFRHLVYLPIRSDVYGAFLYVLGILYVGFMFAFAYRLENSAGKYWVYRPIMNILSTLIFSWLVFYSALTIKKMIWLRG